jgi:hypothetical protein
MSLVTLLNQTVLLLENEELRESWVLDTGFSHLVQKAEKSPQLISLEVGQNGLPRPGTL